MHEEDDRILWKHFDFRESTAEIRRSRKLVISFIATVANYEYAFYWHLFLDGSIEFLVKASPASSPPPARTRREEPRYGTDAEQRRPLRPDPPAPVQRPARLRRRHENAVYEVDTVPEELSELNPHGNAFYATERLLETEQRAIRDADPRAARFWKMVNRRRTNKVGSPVGYRADAPRAQLPVQRT